jgi:protein-tyrosine-phosphatase
MFVCSANSARSQMAAALWCQATGQPAESAGTHPAEHVHPGAVAAAARAGLDLGRAVPRSLSEVSSLPPLAITVCDRAHEEIATEGDERWIHWSIPDPVSVGTDRAFDTALVEISERIRLLVDVAAVPA